MYLINGEFTEHLSVQDRGLHYGDGVFETLVLKNGEPQHWNAHIDRLEYGCQRLNIPVPDKDLLAKELRKLWNEQIVTQLPKLVAKIIVTRGVGQRGYKPQPSPDITRVIALFPCPEYPTSYFDSGVKITICRMPLSCNPVLAGIKHLNRLEQVMAQDEWNDPEIVDGIMLNSNHHVVECTMSNIFWVTNGQLCTPDLSNCGVQGVTRANILQLAKELQIPTTIDYFHIKDLLAADEVMITNSVFGVLPVNMIDDHKKQPGPFTRKLMTKLD